MRELNAEREKTILVGDTPVDINTARNAHIPVVIVETGVELGMANLDEIKTLKPDAIVPSLYEAADYILQSL